MLPLSRTDVEQILETTINAPQRYVSSNSGDPRVSRLLLHTYATKVVACNAGIRPVETFRVLRATCHIPFWTWEYLVLVMLSLALPRAILTPLPWGKPAGDAVGKQRFMVCTLLLGNLPCLSPDTLICSNQETTLGSLHQETRASARSVH